MIKVAVLDDYQEVFQQIIDIEKMLDKIDDDDDVQNVFTNIL